MSDLAPSRQFRLILVLLLLVSCCCGEAVAGDCSCGARGRQRSSRREWRRHDQAAPQQAIPATIAQNALRPATAPTAAKRPGDAIELFDGRSLGKWQETDFAGHGAVEVEDGNLVLRFGEPMTGVNWSGALPLKDNYELTLEAKRVDGSDFFCGLTFPVGDAPCSLIVGGWGGGLVGLSSINGFDASENETTKYVEFKSDRWYRIRLRVAPEYIRAWIDDDQVVDLPRAERKFSVRIEVEASRPLGIATYRTTAALRKIQMRPLAAEPAAAAESK